MNQPLYDGPLGLDRLKAHMRAAFVERAQGSASGWSQDYFQGWLLGLAAADAISADISLAAQDFVSANGYAHP